jgi:hypothetical protein
MGKIYARLTTLTSADETRTFALQHSHSQNLCFHAKETVKPADFESVALPPNTGK